MKVSKRNQRTGRVVVSLDVTAEERAAIDELCRQRGLSIRDLIVSSVLGSEPLSTVARLSKLEARVLLLERGGKS